VAPAYVDSSAVLKLAIREPETAALEAHLAGLDGLVSSRLTVLECRRATRRASDVRVLQSMEDVLDAIYLLDMTQAVLEEAAKTDPPLLRSLDAIHLATALSIGDADVEVITYDKRFADAARANGLTVVQPGVAQTLNGTSERVAPGGAAPPAAQAPLPSTSLLAPRTGGAAGRQDPRSGQLK
jgi:predicted nucleic acid-binding protein